MSGSESTAPEVLVGRVYTALFLAAVVTFVSAGLFFALFIPYHDWDAFAFGELSRAVADGHYPLDQLGAATSHRPLFYVLQGWVWAVTGVSFISGRLLGLGFCVALIGAVWLLNYGPPSVRTSPPRWPG
jgi:hypothetical protein